MTRIVYGLIMGLSILWARQAGALTMEECLQSTGGYFKASCTQRVLESQRTQERELAQIQAQAQVEAARQQALGLALFGSGPALIQGMQQGFRPLPPYQQPGAQR